MNEYERLKERKTELLNQFPGTTRGDVANQFLKPIRDYVDANEEITLDDTLESVVVYWCEKRDRIRRYKSDGCTRIVRLLKMVKTQEALFTDTLEYYRLYHLDERGTIEFKAPPADAVPATEPQLAYLKGLGCCVKPTSKAHASQLIGELKGQ